MRKLVLAFAATVSAILLNSSPLQAQGPDLSVEELKALAPTVKSIRPTPTSLTVQVGKTLSLGGIRLAILDSTGRVRGYTRLFDFSIKPGEPASVVPRTITGVRAGKTEMIVRYPFTAWKPRTDARAEAKIEVIVTP
jgi:hypothetical protein